MNFGVGKNYSVFLMLLRENAPYADALDEVTGMLTYEGHDEPQRQGGPNPKDVDQPLTTPKGSWTENGKFFRAAMDFKSGLREKPELIKVYEKISRGIWSYKGFFELIDAKIVSDGKRKVFKFSLKPVEKKSFGRVVELPHNRLIPTPVKVDVWRRDRGQCVLCGSTKNLHFDHDIPFSKGGNSLSAANVRVLCAKHKLELSNWLRGEGFDCDIDQYHANQDWPAWMERKIEYSDFVLVICTPIYLRRWRNNEKPGVGLGAQWESLLTRQHLYLAPGFNTKFVPVLFEEEHVSSIPTPLTNVTRVIVHDGTEYGRVRDRLLNIAPAAKPPLRTSL